jgi:hypothetical protein
MLPAHSFRVNILFYKLTSEKAPHGDCRRRERRQKAVDISRRTLCSSQGALRYGFADAARAHKFHISTTTAGFWEGVSFNGFGWFKPQSLQRIRAETAIAHQIT